MGNVTTALAGACNKDGVFDALRSQSLSSGPVWTYQLAAAAAQSTNGDGCISAAVWDGLKHQLVIGGTQTATPIDGSQWTGSIQSLSPDADATSRVIWAMGLPCPVLGTPAENGNGVLARHGGRLLLRRLTVALPAQRESCPAQPERRAEPAAAEGDQARLGAFSQPTFADSYLVVASESRLMAYH